MHLTLDNMKAEILILKVHNYKILMKKSINSYINHIIYAMYLTSI